MSTFPESKVFYERSQLGVKRSAAGVLILASLAILPIALVGGGHSGSGGFLGGGIDLLEVAALVVCGAGCLAIGLIVARATVRPSVVISVGTVTVNGPLRSTVVPDGEVDSFVSGRSYRGSTWAVLRGKDGRAIKTDLRSWYGVRTIAELLVELNAALREAVSAGVQGE